MLKKKKDNKKEALAIGAAIAGAAVGAAAVALSSKKNQDMIKKRVKEISDSAVKKGNELKEMAIAEREKMKKAKNEAKAKAKEMEKEIEKDVKKEVKKAEKKVYAPLEKEAKKK